EESAGGKHRHSRQSDCDWHRRVDLVRRSSAKDVIVCTEVVGTLCRVRALEGHAGRHNRKYRGSVDRLHDRELRSLLVAGGQFGRAQKRGLRRCIWAGLDDHLCYAKLIRNGGQRGDQRCRRVVALDSEVAIDDVEYHLTTWKANAPRPGYGDRGGCGLAGANRVDAAS